MLSAIDNVFIKHSEPTKSCLYALHTIMLNFNKDFDEDIKYGMPLITYKKKAFCYIWADKKSKYPYLLFVDGARLLHPDLEMGDRKRMKSLTINPNEDIPVEKIDEIVKIAMSLYD